MIVQLEKLTDGSLERPFSLIETKLGQITAYVDKWLQFQSLWDIESEYVYQRLGDSLSSWQQLLHEIRKTRSTFDNSETSRSFGVAVINYEQVQSKVNAKYDTWQRDILGRFGSKLAVSMKETHSAILKARHDLEQHSIEASSTAATVTFITFVQDLKRKVKLWAPEVEIFLQGQRTLERQRYQFPGDWLHVDQIEGEWTAFNDILARKNASIQEQLGGFLTSSTLDTDLTRVGSGSAAQDRGRGQDRSEPHRGDRARVGGEQAHPGHAQGGGGDALHLALRDARGSSQGGV